jgi:hypothetical protein
LLEQKMLWPDTRVVPFHYPHPVTGKHVAEDDLRAPHYGKDVSTSDPPLSLAPPKDQQESLQSGGSAANSTSASQNGMNGDVKELRQEVEHIEIAA